MSLRIHGKEHDMLFTQIRNATVKLNYDHVCFMIDPWLQDVCTEEEREAVAVNRKFISKPVAALPMPVKEILQGVDVCIITHDHPDHFTPDYLPNDFPLVCQNQKDAEKAESLGFVNVRWFENDVMQFGDVTVKRVGGKHGDSELLAEKAGPVSGFVFSCENEKKVYLAGDTVFCDVVQKVIREEKPDVVIVNSCDARTSSGRLIMNAEDVISTCRCLKNGIVIASHMDAVSHAHLTRKQLKACLEEAGYAQQVLIPEDGETIRI